MDTDYRRLYRSTRDRMIAGVCGGLGNYAKIDPTLVRLIAVVLFFINAPAALLGYLVLALVVPEETVDTPSAD